MLELTPVQQSLVTVYAPALREHGFEVEPFGPGGYLLRAAPAGLRRDDPARAFVELLDLLTREDAPATRAAASPPRWPATPPCAPAKRWRRRRCATCIHQLEACDTPQTCPHGRPTMLHLSADELAKRFSRK